MKKIILNVLLILFSFFVFGKFSTVFAWDNLTGGDHGGANWTISTNTTVSGVHTNVGTFTINSGVTATVQAYDGGVNPTYGKFEVQATTINVVGSINGQAKGYQGTAATGPGGGPGAGTGTCGVGNASGGGHGGKGGGIPNTIQYQSGGGLEYGNFLAPTTMGSSGGAGSTPCTAGRAGGAAVKLQASGTNTISGSINVSGDSAGSSLGGGAGGSIYIIGSTVAGAGPLTANGSASQGSSGGSGGRIALHYSSGYTYTGTIQVNGGSGVGSGDFNGETGTAVKVDDGNNDIYVLLTQIWSGDPNLEGSLSSTTFRDLTLNANSTLYIRGYNTTNTDGVGMVFNIRNLVMNTGSSINGVGYGYQSTMPDNSQGGQGYGQGSCTNNGAGGGGHGGAGANGNGGTYHGGSTYGTASAPITLGSAGGGNNSGSGCIPGVGGGSAIKINASGNINLAGAITMDGAAGGWMQGAGSGGSVYIITDTLSGSGNITAKGGAGGAYAGGGGGGRVSVNYRVSSTWSGTVTVTGGANGGLDTQPVAGGGSGQTNPIPQSPTSLAQYKSDGTTLISNVSATNETTVVLKFLMAAGANLTLRPEVEVQEINTGFSNIPSATGSGVVYSGTPVTGSVSVTNLTDATNFHWQSRICDVSSNLCSDWVAKGASPYDFRVFTNQTPNTPTSLGPSNLINGSSTSDTTPTLTFTLSDPDVSNTVSYNIIIASDANFSNVIVDYTSDLGSQGANSFTVGQLLSGGAYSIGSIGQSLVDGSYYWRVKTYDNSSASSDWTNASILTSAFTVDSSAPNINASNLSFSNAVNQQWSKIKPRITWTDGSDTDGSVFGYCLSLSEANIDGATPSADPALTGGVLDGVDDGVTETYCPFIVNTNNVDLSTISGLNLTSNKIYYVSIKAVDDAGNTFAGSASDYQNLLSFKYDGVAPTNVTSISAAGGTFSSINDMYFSWPTLGNNIASDTGGSGLLGYQYSINDQNSWIGTTTDANTGLSIIPANTDVPLNLDNTRDTNVIVGENIIYFRSVDVAGNFSSSSTYRTASITFGGDAPTFGVDANLTITPSIGTNNSFALSWDAATPATNRTISTYYYMINTVPPATLATLTDNPGTYFSSTSTSVDAQALPAVVRGSNRVYVVAVDDLNNYSPSAYLSATFTLNTTAPDAPKNLAVSDASIKSASLWRASLAWSTPDYIGLGNLLYTIQQSADGTTWTTVGTTTGTAYVDTVSTSSKFYWRVGTSDSGGQGGATPTYSNAVTLTPKGSYTSAADLTSGPAAGSITTKKAKITWTTGRGSDSKIAFGTETGKYNDEEPSNSSQVTDHTINLTNLSPGTTYYYQAKWTDEDGNTGTSTEKTFTTEAAPVIKEVAPSSIGLDSAILNFTSIHANKVKLYYGKTTDFGGSKSTDTSSSESSYSLIIDGLDDGTKYFYRLNGFDSENTEYTGDIYSFETLPRPKVSEVKLQQVADTAETTVLVSWKSNTSISTIVTVYPKNNPTLDRDIVDLTLKDGDHSLVVSSLLPATEYTLLVKGRDKMGNEAVSSSINFTTATDTRPPVVKNVKIVGSATPVSQNSQSMAQIIVSWDTDELSSSQIEFGEGSGFNYGHKSQLDNNLTFNHVVVISNLTPSQVYHLRALSSDAAGNQGISGDIVTIAPKALSSAVDLVVNNLTQIFNIK